MFSNFSPLLFIYHRKKRSVVFACEFIILIPFLKKKSHFSLSLSLSLSVCSFFSDSLLTISVHLRLQLH
jgi:hypothetical protein